MKLFEPQASVGTHPNQCLSQFQDQPQRITYCSSISVVLRISPNQWLCRSACGQNNGSVGFQKDFTRVWRGGGTVAMPTALYNTSAHNIHGVWGMVDNRLVHPSLAEADPVQSTAITCGIFLQKWEINGILSLCSQGSGSDVWISLTRSENLKDPCARYGR